MKDDSAASGDGNSLLNIVNKAIANRDGLNSPRDKEEDDELDLETQKILVNSGDPDEVRRRQVGYVA